MTNFIAKRVRPNVPIWTLFSDDIDIGCMTIFDGEGIVATVELCTSDPAEFRGTSVSEVLAKCRSAVEQDLSWMRAERKAEAFAEAGSSAMAAGMSSEDAHNYAYAVAGGAS